jgi:hypothetical protein
MAYIQKKQLSLKLNGAACHFFRNEPMPKTENSRFLVIEVKPRIVGAKTASVEAKTFHILVLDSRVVRIYA